MLHQLCLVNPQGRDQRSTNFLQHQPREVPCETSSIGNQPSMEISRLFALTGLETGLRRNQQVDITSSTSTVPYESSEVDNHRLVKKVTPSEKELWLGPQDSSDVRAQVKSKNANNGAKGKKYSTRYPLPEKPRQKRAVIQDMVRPLKSWLLRHRHNPYPTKAEKIELALGSNMTLVQVSNWFANARRRLKNVVQDPKCSWSKRLRMYNQFVQGNAELLSIASDDSIWNSDSETEDNDEKKEPEGSASERRETRSEKAFDVAGETSDHLAKASSELNKYKRSMLQRYLSDSLKCNNRKRKKTEEQSKTEDAEGEPNSAKRSRVIHHPRPILPAPPTAPQLLLAPSLPPPMLNCCPPMAFPPIPAAMAAAVLLQQQHSWRQQQVIQPLPSTLTTTDLPPHRNGFIPKSAFHVYKEKLNELSAAVALSNMSGGTH